jgi:membrane protein implicated in regulation of membrane protease activity
MVSRQVTIFLACLGFGGISAFLVGVFGGGLTLQLAVLVLVGVVVPSALVDYVERGTPDAIEE